MHLNELYVVNQKREIVRKSIIKVTYKFRLFIEVCLIMQYFTLTLKQYLDP